MSNWLLHCWLLVFASFFLPRSDKTWLVFRTEMARFSSSSWFSVSMQFRMSSLFSRMSGQCFCEKPTMECTKSAPTFGPRCSVNYQLASWPRLFSPPPCTMPLATALLNGTTSPSSVSKNPNFCDYKSMVHIYPLISFCNFFVNSRSLFRILCQWFHG